MYEGVVQELIDRLGGLPGVGPKSAQRITFYLLQADRQEVQALAKSLLDVTEKITFCRLCGNIAHAELCSICADAERDRSIICVVEEVKDIGSLENTRQFQGLYHVLGGSISPIDGIGPDQLRIKELLSRLADGDVKEVILAMNPNLEGEATATYLARTLTAIGVTVTRLASGLPVGADLEFADELTLARALQGRQEMIL